MKSAAITTLAVLTMLLAGFGCSPEQSSKKSAGPEGTAKTNVASAPDTTTPADAASQTATMPATDVKNELVFTVPKRNQELIGIGTAPLTTNDDGAILVPTDSVEVLDGASVIFVDLGNDKFAVRAIQPDEKGEEFCLVTKNLQEDEKIVTAGVAELKAGVVRMMSEHHGHSHGPGGHTH